MGYTVHILGDTRYVLLNLKLENKESAESNHLNCMIVPASRVVSEMNGS